MKLHDIDRILELAGLGERTVVTESLSKEERAALKKLASASEKSAKSLEALGATMKADAMGVAAALLDDPSCLDDAVDKLAEARELFRDMAFDANDALTKLKESVDDESDELLTEESALTGVAERLGKSYESFIGALTSEPVQEKIREAEDSVLKLQYEEIIEKAVQFEKELQAFKNNLYSREDTEK